MIARTEHRDATGVAHGVRRLDLDLAGDREDDAVSRCTLPVDEVPGGVLLGDEPGLEARLLRLRDSQHTEVDTTDRESLLPETGVSRHSDEEFLVRAQVGAVDAHEQDDVGHLGDLRIMHADDGVVAVGLPKPTHDRKCGLRIGQRTQRTDQQHARVGSQCYGQGEELSLTG